MPGLPAQAASLTPGGLWIRVFDDGFMARSDPRRYTRAMPLDVPVLMPVSLDPDPTIDAYKPGVDRTLLRENLKLTTEERVQKMIAALRLAEEIRRSRTKD